MRAHAVLPARGLVPTLTLATFVNHLNVIAWNPFLPFIATDLGVGVALLGQVPALMMLLATSLGLVIGPLADSYGYRRTLCICLLAVVTSSLATGLAATLSLLVFAALVGAVGRAAIMPLAQAVVASTFSDEAARRRAMSRTQSGGPLAATVGIPMLTASAAVLLWRGAFVVLSGLAFYSAGMNLGVALGAALGGLALAWGGYVALGLCTLALPLAAAGLVWWCHLWPWRRQSSLSSRIV